jgi:hypothetical protein
MQGWLRLWDKPFVPASKEMVWMLMGSKPLDEAFQQDVIDCGKSAEGMPGLASNWAMSSPAFVTERKEIWYTDGYSSFYAIRVTNGAW